ncbi:sec-independent protein translocase protein TatB [Methylobacillus rhizosphaerae]|uniref:Sec-independent protein translocase protein TatB n=1 Tax=Methylobacillus rhizosphaerae TaxID=551994 RepID=A0A238Z4S9_9PROT|nr:Sec-independent protein translocase protein TatB [Methylobacillus rhizosphaerae]SNR77989.1 sec-independent protein translocase protein TatB [Methylobacillus rhizosphaerae]
MFDIAFSELVVIAVVALIVIGPERLPKVVRTVGLLLGRMQRYVNDVKSEINRELRVDELQRLQTDVKQSLQQAENSMHDSVSAIEKELQGIAQLSQEEQDKLAKDMIVRTAPPAPRQVTRRETAPQQPDQESQPPGGTTN